SLAPLSLARNANRTRSQVSGPPHVPEHELPGDDASDVLPASGVVEILPQRQIRQQVQRVLLDVGRDLFLRAHVRSIQPGLDPRLYRRQVGPAEPGLVAVRSQ